MIESYRRAFSKPFISMIVGFGVLALSSGAQAAATEAQNPEAAKYATCVAKLEKAPAAALDMATAWRANGGGVAAQHCIAMALISLKKYDEGAKRLEEVAKDLQTGNGTLGVGDADNHRLLPEVYGQAGNAWLMAGNYSRAYSILSAGVADTPPWMPLLGDLLLDRSRALVGMGQYGKALKDLDRARDAFPKRADIRIYRAAALRKLKRLAEAAADLQVALALDPGNPEALLERGNLYLATGDANSARADWSKVVVGHPGTPEAAAAQKNIGMLLSNRNKPLRAPRAATHP